MKRINPLKALAVFTVGGIPLVTAATCGPYGSFFRDDDGDGYCCDYYDPGYYDPCYYDDCYYEDTVYIDPYYGP